MRYVNECNCNTVRFSKLWVLQQGGWQSDEILVDLNFLKFSKIASLPKTLISHCGQEVQLFIKIIQNLTRYFCNYDLSLSHCLQTMIVQKVANWQS